MSKAFVKESDSEADLSYEPPAIPAGIKNYMTPQGHRQNARSAASAVARRAPQSGGNGCLSGWKRRSVGERRLHLRKTSPSRDRPARPLLINAAGERRGGGPEAAEEAGPGLFRRIRHLRQRARERKDHHNRRYRRGRSQSRSGELGIAGRQGTDEGAGRRHRVSSRAVRARAD